MVWRYGADYCFLHDKKAELPRHKAPNWFKKAHEHQYLDIKKEVEGMELGLDGDELDAAIVMLASFDTGQDEHQIYLYLGCNVYKYKINKFARNLRNNGVWQSGMTYCQWMDEEDGGIAFVLDCLVATGKTQRVEPND